MQWLVLIHVLSAVIGLGPAYAFPVLLRKNPSLAEVTRMTELVNRLETFPKIFGTLAVVSGLVLVWLGSYGAFMSIWLFGALMVYVAAEVVVIGFLAPAAKRLSGALVRLNEASVSEIDQDSISLLGKVRNLHIVVSVLATIIFVLMVIKPV